MEEFIRTGYVIGEDGLKSLSMAKVALFGVGGVGSYAAEALARSGVGSVLLVDPDVVSVSNINRQLVALHSTVGMKKTEVMARRMRDINPNMCVEQAQLFYSAENADEINVSSFDYIIDAIDTVSSKLLLIERAYRAEVPIISCMGAGNKLEPTRLEVDDISNTSVCPLARVMRRELKKRGIERLKVVYSKEEPVKTQPEEQNGRHIPGSVAFVPSVAGLIIAGEVIKTIAGGVKNG